MKRKHRLKLSIYPKIVLVFLLVIVPICTLCLIINQKGKESVKEALSKQLEISVQHFLDSFTKEISLTGKHQQEFILDKDLMSVSFGGSLIKPYEMSQRMLSIEEKLGMMRDSSALIRNVSAYIPILNRDLSTLGGVSALPVAEYDMAKEAGRADASKIVEWEGRLFIALAYPSLAINDKPPSYAMSIELDVNALKQELAQFAKDRGSGYVLWNDQQSWGVASGQDAELEQAVQASLRAKHAEGTLTGVDPYRYAGTDYIVVHRYVPGSDLSLAVYVPEEEVLGQLSVYGQWFWIILNLSVVVILFFSAWIYRQIHRPMSRLVKSLRKVEKGVLEKMPEARRGDEFAYLYAQFNAMVDQLNVLIHQVYEQRIRSQSSELKQLQSQINPHFLYNTYFSLYRLAKLHDIDQVILFCEHLGNYFQYITRTGAESVPIGLELKHTRAYADIQGIRFGARIAVTFGELPAEMAELHVPQLFLQPILENAYNHGLDDVTSGGRIDVTLLSTAHGHRIVVEDNGQALTDAGLEALRNKLKYRGDEIETTGLLNVHRRMELFYGEGSGIELDRSGLGGLRVTIHIGRNEGGHQGG